jgi:peptide/nickel transport system ATP-binding protein
MIRIQDLRVEIDAETGVVRAIDGLRLAIQRGETFALVGESGCGKSMTALALMRLLPEAGHVAGGDIQLDAGRPRDGQEAGRLDLLALPESRMRGIRGGRIGMIFQEPATSLNPVMKVGDQIVEAIEAHTPLRGRQARAKAIEWLERVGIPEPQRRIDDYPFRMSGGQKQRVMIAIALAAEPDFLIADEPTTALDVTIQAQILDLLKDLQREHRMGLLLITHDLAVVSGMAHRVALMYAGQIVEVAEAQAFFGAPKHPYARALLRALPDAARRGQPLQAIAGTVPLLNQAFSGCRYAPRCAEVMAHCPTTLPDLDAAPGSGGHLVRCLLYVAGEPSGLPPGPQLAAGQPQADTPAPGGRMRNADGDVGVAHGGAAAAAPGQGIAAATRDAPLLEVHDLSVRFPIRGGLLQRVKGHFDAVRDVSFTVARGQTLALVGESGSGKTTTGKAIVQLLRGIAEVDGRALLEGCDLLELQGAELRAARRSVQIIFQDPFSSLNPRMRVAEILDEGLAALQPDLDAGQRQQRIATIAEQVGLRREALGRWPHEFSGGQRQRIAIARALAVEPRLIVCDEPTSALDVSVQAQILNLLRELQRGLGVSYLFITHNIGVVEYIADRVAVMQNGRILEQGSTAEVLARPRHDYTQALLAAVPRLKAAA